MLPEGAGLTASFEKGLLGGVVVIKGKGMAVSHDAAGGDVRSEAVTVTAVPYCVWANRGQGEMVMWFAKEAGGAVAATRGGE